MQAFFVAGEALGVDAAYGPDADERHGPDGFHDLLHSAAKGQRCPGSGPLAAVFVFVPFIPISSCVFPVALIIAAGTKKLKFSQI